MYLATDHYFPPLATPHPWRPQVSTLLERGSGRINEDVVLFDGNLFGVFDGATSLDGETFAGGTTSGGLLAADIARRTFAENDASLASLAARANRRIATVQLAHGIDVRQRHRLWSTSMAVLRLEGDSFSYCQIGDAAILLLHEDGSHRLLTAEVDIDGETLAQWQQAAQAGATDIYETLGEQIRRVRLEMNHTYGVLNGEERALGFLNHGRQSLDGVHTVLLFTDGLHLPRRSPRLPGSWEEFAAIYRRSGLNGLRDEVRRRQRQDPRCHAFPRFKCHDDIAAVAIDLEPMAHPATALA